jgi:predicted PurR-regulated permease PerM
MNHLRNLQLFVLVCVLLYFGKAVLIPITFGLVIAMIAYPLCKSLEQRKFPRSLTIFIALLAVMTVFAAIGMLLIWEAEVLYKQIPLLTARLTDTLNRLQDWIETRTGMDADAQIIWLKNIFASVLGGLAGLVNASFSAAFSALFNLLMIPVFAALILSNRERYVAGLAAMLPAQHRDTLPAILARSIHAFFRYVLGMGKVYLIVGILNSIGLMLLGIENAWIFGLITAVMTIIPYVGILISGMLPVSVAWSTYDSGWYALGVVAVFVVVQYLEANIIFPKVVGQQLNLNTLAALVGIMIGGLLWGVSGMVLVLPILGILRIVSEEVPGLEALRIWLGTGKIDK